MKEQGEPTKSTSGVRAWGGLLKVKHQLRNRPKTGTIQNAQKYSTEVTGNTSAKNSARAFGAPVTFLCCKEGHGRTQTTIPPPTIQTRMARREDASANKPERPRQTKHAQVPKMGRKKHGYEDHSEQRQRTRRKTKLPSARKQMGQQPLASAQERRNIRQMDQPRRQNKQMARRIN